MSSPQVQPPPIAEVSADQRLAAFTLIFSHLAAEEQRQQVETLTSAAASGNLSPQGLLGTHRGGRLVGAVLLQIQPGKTANVWPPRIVADEPASTALRLLEAACDRLAQHKVRIAQVQLPTDAGGDDTVLREVGFDHLTDLLYLVAAEDKFPTQSPQSSLAFQSSLEFEPYSIDNHDRLTRIVDATYEQTRDCPQLDGVRQIEDVLAGYRATGTFDPSRWLIVRHAHEDIGCLLLSDHPEHGNWELVYMGVAARHRGHGWGIDIARHAQWLTRCACRRRLVLAVDAENDPGIAMYASVGFRAWERRAVYLKVFPEKRL